jgi:hypothetical protein
VGTLDIFLIINPFFFVTIVLVSKSVFIRILPKSKLSMAIDLESLGAPILLLKSSKRLLYDK